MVSSWVVFNASLSVSGTEAALSGVVWDSTAEFASLIEAGSEELLSIAKAEGAAKQERQSMNAISSAVNRCRNLYFCFINTSNKKSTCELQVLRLFCVILFLAEGIHPSTVVLSEGHSPVGVLTICGIAEPTGDSHGGEVGADDVCVMVRAVFPGIANLTCRTQRASCADLTAGRHA